MAFHPDITPRSREDTAAGLAQLALSKAKKQQTRKAGSATWHNEDGTRTVIGPDAGTSGIAPWVGDTTAPGMPTGIGVDSAAGMILVSWNGSLDGGVPADFDHVSILVDGTEAGQLRVMGTATLGPYEADSVHQVTVRAWDDAHAEGGSPAPNGSEVTAPISVTVKSVVDTGQIKAAQDKAQAAINAAVGAETTASSASKTAAEAKTIAGSKNRIIASASEPSHGGLALGDLWMQLDRSNNVVGIQVWNGKSFVDYVLLAQQVLVAGSVGTICLADGAVVADKITASEALLEKLLVRKIKADEIDVGSLTAAIVESRLFTTPDGLVGFDESGYWAKDKNGDYIFRVSRDGVQATGGFQTASKGDRVQLTQTQIKGAVTGCLQGIGDSQSEPYWLILGSHGMTGTRMLMGTSPYSPQFEAGDGDDLHSFAGITAEDVEIKGDVTENFTPKYHLKPRMAFAWSSDATGYGPTEPTTEFSEQISVPGPGEGRWYHLDMGARVAGTGEYGMSVELAGPKTYQYRLVTAQLVNPVVDNYTLSKMIFLVKGTYQISLVVQAFGTPQINNDPTWNFCDPGVSDGRFSRYVTLVEA